MKVKRGMVKFKKAVGGALFVVGTYFLISSQSGMTGAVISEKIKALSSVLGLGCVIAGILLALGKF